MFVLSSRLSWWLVSLQGHINTEHCVTYQAILKSARITQPIDSKVSLLQ